MAGLNRLRAKELSAAEVRRGLRRNVTGGGQNIIPTMSFYAPKVCDACKHERLRKLLVESLRGFLPKIRVQGSRAGKERGVGWSWNHLLDRF